MTVAAGAAACDIVLAEHRTDRVLARWPAQPGQPLAIRFTHSVLGTVVRDRYEMRRHRQDWRAHLVEESFEGEGYGLPHAALGPGESLQREGGGWRLRLDRPVQPLVVRPTLEQDPWLEIGMHAIRLLDMGRSAMVLNLQGCAPL